MTGTAGRRWTVLARGSWAEASRVGGILRRETVGGVLLLIGAVVAKQGFEALMKGKEKVVAGSTKTKVQGAASKIMPDSAKAKMHSRMAEPGSGDQ